MGCVCILFVGLLFLLIGEVVTECPHGFEAMGRQQKCIDIDECEETERYCGSNSKCNNTVGSYFCSCNDGFALKSGNKLFTADAKEKCLDFNECVEQKEICGDNSKCDNTEGSYICTCEIGFVPSNGMKTFKSVEGVTCEDRDEREGSQMLCGKNTVCSNTLGSYYCICEPGYRMQSGKTNFIDSKDVCEAEKKMVKVIISSAGIAPVPVPKGAIFLILAIDMCIIGSF